MSRKYRNPLQMSLFENNLAVDISPNIVLPKLEYTVSSDFLLRPRSMYHFHIETLLDGVITPYDTTGIKQHPTDGIRNLSFSSSEGFCIPRNALDKLIALVKFYRNADCYLEPETKVFSLQNPCKKFMGYFKYPPFSAAKFPDLIGKYLIISIKSCQRPICDVFIRDRVAQNTETSNAISSSIA